MFQVTDEGLWDGRPSLGGVWVAHPDVVDPERVIIRNTATGSFRDRGAVHRRERDNPARRCRFRPMRPRPGPSGRCTRDPERDRAAARRTATCERSCGCRSGADGARPGGGRRPGCRARGNCRPAGSGARPGRGPRRAGPSLADALAAITAGGADAAPPADLAADLAAALPPPAAPAPAVAAPRPARTDGQLVAAAVTSRSASSASRRTPRALRPPSRPMDCPLGW